MFKFLLLLLLGVACLLSPTTAGSLEGKHFLLVKDTMMEICNTDGQPGVCWEEVQTCVEKHQTILTESEFPAPTREEFDSVDVNKDGTVTVTEWETFVVQF